MELNRSARESAPISYFSITCILNKSLYMYRYFISIVLCFVAAPLLSQTRKPITHEVMWAMKRVANPELSPDGKWTVVSVSETAYDEKENVNDLGTVGTA